MVETKDRLDGVEIRSDVRPATVCPGCGRGITPGRQPVKEATTMADAGPPLVLIAVGLVLWLAVTATIAGISIQTIGLILFVVGVVWLLIELVQVRGWRRRDVVVQDRPVVRDRDVY